jgi:hypothetical protein
MISLGGVMLREVKQVSLAAWLYVKHIVSQQLYCNAGFILPAHRQVSVTITSLPPLTFFSHRCVL